MSVGTHSIASVTDSIAVQPLPVERVWTLAGADGRARCWWAGDDQLYLDYHDREWGRPQHDGRALFEKVCLESFQSGLSWLTILRKRENFRAAFAGFQPELMAEFDGTDVDRLLADAGIVRNRAKIEAVVANARCLLSEFGSVAAFSEYIWAFAPASDAPDPGIGGTRQRPAKAGLAVLRTHDRIRLHAGRRVSRRPCSRLLVLGPGVAG